MRNLIAKAYEVLTDAIGHLARDDGWAMASHLALSGLTAIFPFLIFVAALASFIGHAQLADSVTELIFQAWPATIAEPISNEIRNVLTAPRRGSIDEVEVGKHVADSLRSKAAPRGLDRGRLADELQPDSVPDTGVCARKGSYGHRASFRQHSSPGYHPRR